jgi:hypothetical protein
LTSYSPVEWLHCQIQKKPRHSSGAVVVVVELVEEVVAVVVVLVPVVVVTVGGVPISQGRSTDGGSAGPRAWGHSPNGSGQAHPTWQADTR